MGQQVGAMMMQDAGNSSDTTKFGVVNNIEQLDPADGRSPDPNGDRISFWAPQWAQWQ